MYDFQTMENRVRKFEETQKEGQPVESYLSYLFMGVHRTCFDADIKRIFPSVYLLFSNLLYLVFSIRSIACT